MKMKSGTWRPRKTNRKHVKDFKGRQLNFHIKKVGLASTLRIERYVFGQAIAFDVEWVNVGDQFGNYWGHPGEQQRMGSR